VIVIRKCDFFLLLFLLLALPSTKKLGLCNYFLFTDNVMLYAEVFCSIAYMNFMEKF